MSGVHDFDFLHGGWIVSHRRLRHRGVNCTIAAAVAPLDPLLTAPSEFIRLEPTDRSNLR